MGMGVRQLGVTTLCRVLIAQTESVEFLAVGKNGTDTIIDFILEYVEIEIHESGVFVGFLEASRIKWNREAVESVGKQVAEDSRGFRDLREKNVHWPDWVALPVAEFNEKHFAADKLID